MKPAILLFVILFSVATGSTGARNVSASSGEAMCYANCVITTRSGNELLFVAKDRRGKIFATANLTLPKNARALRFRGSRSDDSLQYPDASQQSGLPVGSVCGGVSGVCTEHSSLTYETPSQYVIVSITYFFFDGNLQDIDVDETRIAKSKIK